MPELSMISPRYKYPISNAELTRRIEATRKAMADSELDCIILQSFSPIFDANIRYFIDQQTDPYTTAILLPKQGGLFVVTHGPELGAPIHPEWERGCDKILTKPYCLPFTFTDDLLGETFAAEIREKGYKRIGFVDRQLISYSFGAYLERALPEAEFVDFSNQFHLIKSVKSAEEWELIGKTISVHDQLMAAVPALIRPGRLEQEVRSDIERMALNLSCDAIGNLAVASGPAGSRVMFTKHFCENRRIEKGDTVSVMIEVAAPGGIYGELSRTFCLSKPSDSLLDLYKIARDCQHAVADAMKPGTCGRELNEVFNAFVTRHGLAENARFIGHGQGYDMMECPAFCGGDELPILEDCFVAIHPELDRGTDFANACDNFRVTKNGAVLLNKTPQQVFCIET